MKPAAAKNTDTQQLLKTLRAANRLIEAASRGELSNRMPLEAQGKPLRGEMLRTARAVNSLLERLRAGDEETRKDGHSDLYNIIKNNDDGILVVDSGGVVRFANPAAAALLRRNAQALVGRPFPYSAQAGKLTEVEIPHAGGEPGVAELRATAILWEGQKAVLATLRDITERKRSEEKLRQSEVQFRLIAENVADLIALVDLDGRRLYSSPSYRILGNLGALRGSDSFNEIHPEDREKIKLVFEETLRTGVGQRAEYRFLLKDGSIRFIESQGDVIRDKSGKIERIVVVSRDVTERKKMEEKEKLLQQQLLQAEKLKSLGETLAGVAHELNNPLTGIIGFCELLLQAETVKQHPQTRQDIEEIFKQSQRCKRIIQGLSTFARRHKPSKKLIAINAMIEDCLRLEAYHFRTKNIKIHPTLGPDLPDTMADDHQLQQVLLNLFINAYQAIKKHREHGNLYVRTSHRSGFIRLEIEDDGPGIPAENLNRIFEPFFTTKDIGQGTGLGLSICYGIIREHGGKIWAESPPGRGALFVVELPIVQEAEPEPEPEAAPELNLPTGLKVLVVDDEQVVQTVLRRVLSQMNARIEEALDGHAAVDKLERNDYDAIICDVNMPGIDGRKLYQWVQENKPHLLSRWIFITGSVTEQTQQFLIDTGRPIIKKPFDIRRIQEALQDLF